MLQVVERHELPADSAIRSVTKVQVVERIVLAGNLAQSLAPSLSPLNRERPDIIRIFALPLPNRLANRFWVELAKVALNFGVTILQ